MRASLGTAPAQGEPLLGSWPLPTRAVPTGPQRPAAHLRGEAPGLRDPSGQRGLQAPGDGRGWADPGPGPGGTCEHPNIASTQNSLHDTLFYTHRQQVCFFDLLGQQMKAFMFAACPGARLWQKQRQGHGQSVSLPAAPATIHTPQAGQHQHGSAQRPQQPAGAT